MVRDVIFVDHKTPVVDVCRLMGEKRIGSVIVTKENKPYGIFTERDLLSKVLVGGNLGDEVGKYVSAPLITIPPDTSVRDSARIMAEKRIKRLVIVENDEIKGAIYCL